MKYNTTQFCDFKDIQEYLRKQDSFLKGKADKMLYLP